MGPGSPIFIGMDTRTNNWATGIRGKTGVAGEGMTEAEHFIVCGDCGQAYDMRELGEVVHHLESDHRPLPTS